MSQSTAELTLEQLEDLYQTRHELEHSLGQLSGEPLRDALHQLAEVSHALGEEAPSDDPLIDKWEQEIAEGKTPDLTER